jgi:hypothetical protein
MKKLVLTAACAIALGAFHPAAARADDPAKAEEKAAIQWVEGWSAGRAEAKKSGKLMLVYVHRTSPS